MIRSLPYLRLQLLLICALLASACTQRIDSGETLPAAASEPPQLQRLSRLELRASLPLAQIQAALDEALPREQDIDERIKIRVPLIDDPRIPFHGSVTRTPLQLRPASPAIAFSSVLDGHGSAPTRWTVRGRVDGTIQPMIDGAYRLRSRLAARGSRLAARIERRHRRSPAQARSPARYFTAQAADRTLSRCAARLGRQTRPQARRATRPA